ncbi:hypothetical protein TNIN_104751 [Trichonephila inaurata madagascariensis]|uniref:Uncharacterized protein n=1 Tax=Trichonephila inaurata madagascariensis TaxID=2747483 RepID=A0A8X7BYG7_9ARAC|nr:hypothetical protein TNIN_104751 [Trichonephila inaurata madagascariensis]
MCLLREILQDGPSPQPESFFAVDVSGVFNALLIGQFPVRWSLEQFKHLVYLTVRRTVIEVITVITLCSSGSFLKRVYNYGHIAAFADHHVCLWHLLRFSTSTMKMERGNLDFLWAACATFITGTPFVQ